MSFAALRILTLCVVAIAVTAGAISSTSELSFDENQRTTENYLLYAGDASCTATIEGNDLDYRPAFELSGDLASKYFGPNPSEYGNCAAVCVQRGTLQEHVLHPLPEHTGKNLSNVFSFAFETCQKTEVGFLSYNTNPANVYWVNPRGKRSLVGNLLKGERHTFWQVSFLGHRFAIEDSVTKELLLEVTVEYDAIFHIGNHKSDLHIRDVSRGVRDTCNAEWGRANRVRRTFTEFGFSKGRLPNDLWASISSYYYNNRDHKVLEEWDTRGLYVNWWETDVFFIPMPWELKRIWQKRIKLLVEAWTGVDLETTDIYGMRRYEDGARLLSHVDRESTHAASIIMNIAQGNVRTPWKVEIYDFANRLHEVTMEPGEIVYYESARCLHGRVRPLDGGYYVNLFAHYRPNGDPEWFLKPNPPGTPAPAMDIGTCTSDGTAVTCTGPYDVPYLSPTLATLTGPHDMYQHWLDTDPKVLAAKKHNEL